MTPAFAQDVPTTPSIPSGGGGGGGGGISINFPTVDWQTLIPQLVGYFFDGIGKWLTESMHKTFDGFWGSGANVVGHTDLAMTWGFGPVHDQIDGIQSACRAILICALILVGCKSMLGGIIPRWHDIAGEFTTSIIVSVIMVAAFPLVLPQIIEMTNQAAQAVGTADVGKYVNNGGVDQNPLLEAVLFIILLFYGLRLLIKASWRVMFLAVLLPFGLVACALYSIPSMRWIFSWWARVWGGMLLAQIPSVFALSIGLALFSSGGGLGAFVWSIAAMQLATDLYSLIPFGGIGHSPSPVAEAAAGLRTYAGVGALAAGGAARLPAMTNAAVQHHIDYGY